MLCQCLMSFAVCLFNPLASGYQGYRDLIYAHYLSAIITLVAIELLTLRHMSNETITYVIACIHYK